MEETILRDLSVLNWKDILDQALKEPTRLPIILQHFSVTTSDLIQVARRSESIFEPYGRQVLYRSPDIEVMLAHWSYDAASCPHNHGFSKGLIWFMQGSFQEQHFEFKNRALNKIGDVIKYNQGEVTLVMSNDIHSSRSLANGISLHLYSPSIHSMKVWDTDNQETLTVADECGAWVPKDQALITKRVKWT